MITGRSNSIFFDWLFDEIKPTFPYLKFKGEMGISDVSKDDSWW